MDKNESKKKPTTNRHSDQSKNGGNTDSVRNRRLKFFLAIWFMSFGSSGDLYSVLQRMDLYGSELYLYGVVRVKFRIFPAWFFSMNRK